MADLDPARVQAAAETLWSWDGEPDYPLTHYAPDAAGVLRADDERAWGEGIVPTGAGLTLDVFSMLTALQSNEEWDEIYRQGYDKAASRVRALLDATLPDSLRARLEGQDCG